MQSVLMILLVCICVSELSSQQQQQEVACVGAPLDGVYVRHVPCPADVVPGSSHDAATGAAASTPCSLDTGENLETSKGAHHTERREDDTGGAPVVSQFELVIGGHQIARSSSGIEPGCSRCNGMGCTYG